MAERREGGEDLTRAAVQARFEGKDTDSYQAFLDELAWSGIAPPRVEPRRAAEAVLCTLARRLSGGEVEDIASAVTPGLARLIRSCDRHEGPARAHRIGRLEFLGDVADHLGVPQGEAEPIVRAVFTAVRDRLPADEVEDVAAQLPVDLADLFRRPV
jgi:uncharacterized protein (DUF2267 family)